MTYASAIQYAPHGPVSGMTYGSGLLENRYYNNRLQMCQLQTTSGTLSPLTLGFSYTASGVSNTGNLMQQTITTQDYINNFPTSYVYTQNYTYDAVNRLVTASESGGDSWTQTNSYDQYGNRWVSAGTVLAAALTPQSSSWFLSNNRINGAAYDGSGNLTGYGSLTLGYDGENRQTSAFGGSTSATYSYDGEGRRIRQVANGVTTTYVYDALGRLAAEYSDFNPSTTGQLQTAGTHYRVTDHLGSTRLLTEASGGGRRFDYWPFGEDLLSVNRVGNGSTIAARPGYGQAAPRVRFTGKERDAETGLDYFGARYYSGAEGRFTSPDPLLNSGRPWEPQSWNRYAYTLNNPLTFTDPDGLWEFGSCSYSKSICQAYQNRIRTGYDNLVKYASSFEKGSDARKALDRVIAYLGKEGNKNGVKLSLATLPGARGAQFDASTKSITFDLPKLDALLIDPKAFAAGYRTTTEISGEIAHEGTHLTDVSQGLVNPQIPANGRVNWTALENSETRAYTNESYVFQGAGVRSINQLWNPNWAAAEAEALRSKAVKQWTKESVDDMKAQAAKQGLK